MRLGIVSTWEPHCGIATYTRALREQLLALGIECDVVPIDRTEVKYLARRELRPWFRALAERLEGYDVVHVQHEHGIFGGSHALPTSVSVTRDLLGRLARHGAPVVVTFHTEPIDLFGPPVTPFALGMGMAQRAHWRASMALIFRRNPRLRAVVHTRASRRAFVDSGMPPGAVEIVPHGMAARTAPPPSPAERRAARERLGIDPDHVVLTQFGFLARYKGIPTAVEALRHLPPDVELAVLGGVHPHGGDDTLERVLAAVDDDGSARPGLTPVAGRVRVEGWIPPERFDDWRSAASFALAPYEPVLGFSFSGALTWAFGAGVPIVASRVPAFVELQEEAECLALVSPGAPREIAHRVGELRADPARAQALATAAQRHAERCSWPRVAERHAQLYEAALADHAASSRTRGSTSWRSARSASVTNGSSSSHAGAARSRDATIRR